MDAPTKHTHNRQHKQELDVAFVVSPPCAGLATARCALLCQQELCNLHSVEGSALEQLVSGNEQLQQHQR